MRIFMEIFANDISQMYTTWFGITLFLECDINIIYTSLVVWEYNTFWFVCIKYDVIFTR